MELETGSPSNEIKDKREQAEKIRSSIRSLEKELEQIQENCIHAEYELKNCQTANSGFNLRRVCKICTKEIGFPTQEEVKQWTEN